MIRSQPALSISTQERDVYKSDSPLGETSTIRFEKTSAADTNMVSSSTVLCLALCVAAASAQIIVPGPCQDVTVEQNFDLQAYLGRWYEYKKFFTFFQLNGKCVSATYTDNFNDTVQIRNYLVKEDTNEVDIILGSAYQNSDTDEGKLIISFPSIGGEAGDYWVLDTDYENYSVVWSCVNSGGQSLQLSWLLTRERVPSADILAAADAVIAANGLNADKYIITDHTDCPPDDQF